MFHEGFLKNSNYYEETNPLYYSLLVMIKQKIEQGVKKYNLDILH